jgi:predicted MFS family arabinose efflux permease
MASKNAAIPASPVEAAHDSWLPLVIIVIAQIQMAFNVMSIPVLVGPIVDDLGVSATDVGTALVFYSLFVAGFVLLGARIGKMVGERLAFQVTVLVHGAAMALMAAATSSGMMNLAQAIAGLAAAVLVPALVVLIAANYRGKQQAQALGVLAGAPAVAGAVAFFVAGWMGTALSWRVPFGLLAGVAVLVFVLSFRLAHVPPQKGIRIDWLGALFAALSIALISLGFNNLNEWGLIGAKDAAPFSVMGVSPAPLMIVLGLVLAQAFFYWSHRRAAKQQETLVALEIMDSPSERSAWLALLIISGLGPAINFLVPLYIQIVQGRTSLFTAVAVVPYALAIAASAMLVVRIYGRLTARQIGLIGFILVSVGLVLLSVTIQNDWQTAAVIISLIIVGVGEGALLTLLFNVLVSSSPKEQAGDVGALRGVANNLATGLGTAFAGVVAVGVLAFFVGTSVAVSPIITDELLAQLNLDNVNFITNDQLESVLGATDASPEQVDEAVRINEEVRLSSLRVSFLFLAAIGLLGLVPALGLPSYNPAEIKPETPAKSGKRQEKAKLRT